MPRPRPPKFDLDALSDEQLLNTRFRDLPIAIEGTYLEGCVQKLYAELEGRGLLIRPACYLGDEWFSPEGSPSIAIPFYLAHPRLQQLELKMMLEIEGGKTEAETLKLLRHECGHSVIHAYSLLKRRDFKKAFGDPRSKFRDYYKFHPYSRNFVRHLQNWYAQSHPEEDFAETFAVWLAPGEAWRELYRNWPALKKLEYVDAVMKEMAGKPPVVTEVDKSYNVRTMKKRLATHYEQRSRLYAEEDPGFFDADLKRLYSPKPEEGAAQPAVQFLKRNRALFETAVSHWTRERKFTVHRLLNRLIARCGELKLYLTVDEPRARVEMTAYLSALASHYLFTGRFKQPNERQGKALLNQDKN